MILTMSLIEVLKYVSMKVVLLRGVAVWTREEAWVHRVYLYSEFGFACQWQWGTLGTDQSRFSNEQSHHRPLQTHIHTVDIMLKRHSYCHWQANHNLLYIRTTGSHRMRQTQMYIHTHIHAYILPVRLYTVQFVLLRTYYTIPCHIPTEQPGWRGVKGVP